MILAALTCFAIPQAKRKGERPLLTAGLAPNSGPPRLSLQPESEVLRTSSRSEPNRHDRPNETLAAKFALMHNRCRSRM
jgi:hypothetical protein